MAGNDRNGRGGRDASRIGIEGWQDGSEPDNEETADSREESRMENTLLIEDLTMGFRRKTVLHHISLEMKNGIYGILGPNGAGKTTLFRCITNLYEGSYKQISLNGCEKSDKAYPFQIGYVPQKFAAFRQMKVAEMLYFFADMQRVEKQQQKKRVEECIQVVHLEEKANSRVATLSGGMLRRLGIAQALLNRPALLILDEPTAGLDPEERIHFLNLIASLEGDQIVLIATHIVEDVESVADEIVVLNQGRVLRQGSRQEIQKLAEGRTYELTEDRVKEITGEYFILHTMQRQEEKMIHIVTKDVQEQFSPVPPTLEDGYICQIREYVQDEEAVF